MIITENPAIPHPIAEPASSKELAVPKNLFGKKSSTSEYMSGMAPDYESPEKKRSKTSGLIPGLTWPLNAVVRHQTIPQKPKSLARLNFLAMTPQNIPLIA